MDGGLAHVQERMIAYCAQDRGYRVLQVMTPQQAARSYARIEYKAQLYAAQYTSNNVLEHRLEMGRHTRSLRHAIYLFLRSAYGLILRKFPNSRRWLRPAKDRAVAFLLGSAGPE